MKKKTLVLMLAVAMVVTLFVGCAAPAETASPSPAADEESSAPETTTPAEEETPPAEPATETFEVAFLPTDMSHTFASWLAEELEKAFDGYDNMNLTVIDSQNVLQNQISAMETCVAQGYDYIILLPLEPAAEGPLVEQYIADGTPMMNINLDDGSVATASSVIAKPYDLGTVVAENAMNYLEEDSKVVVLLGPSGNTDSIERRRAYEDVIFSQYPNIEILDEQIGGWEKSNGVDFMDNWIQAYGDEIDAVLSMNDAMALGTIEAAKAAGVLDQIKYFGVDGLADAAVSIEAGELTATALQDAQVMAVEAARIVNEVLTGQNTEGFEKMEIPVTLITSDNVDEFITRYTENGLLDR